ERFLDLGHGGRLRLLAAGLLRDADQHVRWPAERLQLDVAEIERRQLGAHLRDVGGAGFRLQLDQRAAAEIDAEIEPGVEEQQDRDDRQQRRDRKADAPKAHEIERRVVRDDAYQRNFRMKAHLSHEIRRRCGRCQRTHHETMRRVSVKAVNTVVMMPTPSVTAKPRTGPVPMKNSTAAAMKVVMLESRMVASARVKPASIAATAVRPPRTSSRMRS